MLQYVVSSSNTCHINGIIIYIWTSSYSRKIQASHILYQTLWPCHIIKSRKHYTHARLQHRYLQKLLPRHLAQVHGLRESALKGSRPVLAPHRVLEWDFCGLDSKCYWSCLATTSQQKEKQNLTAIGHVANDQGLPWHLCGREFSICTHHIPSE